MSAIPRPAHFYQFTNIDQTFLRLYATITPQPLSHNLLKNLRNNSSNELQKQALFLSRVRVRVRVFIGLKATHDNKQQYCRRFARLHGGVPSGPSLATAVGAQISVHTLLQY